jgi:D-alanyl-D-alanine carboxypeptidase
VDDIDRWIRALHACDVLPRATLERAWTPVQLKSGLNTGYGFGWFVGSAFGQRTIEHSGGIHGFSSFQLWLPARDLSVVVLSNSAGGLRSPGAVALDLAGIVLDAPAAPAAIPATAEALQQYIGVYRIDVTQSREVFRRGDTLLTRVGRNDPARLIPVAPDEFVIAGTQNRLLFDRPTGGPVVGLLSRPRVGPESRAPRVAETLEEEPTVALRPEVLDRYVGTYQLAPRFELVVTREGAALVTQATGQGTVPLRAVADTEFVAESVNGRIVFNVDASGRATGLVLHQGGRSVTAPRIR